MRCREVCSSGSSGVWWVHEVDVSGVCKRYRTNPCHHSINEYHHCISTPIDFIFNYILRNLYSYIIYSSYIFHILYIL